MTKEQAAGLLELLPEEVANAISKRARDTQMDVQTIVIELLAQGLRAEPPATTDLDEFIGSWEEDPEFDEAMAAFEVIDESLWK